jgi:hypothetical protein
MIEMPMPVSDTNGSHPDDVLEVIEHQYWALDNPLPITYSFSFQE